MLQIPVSAEQENLSSRGANCDSNSINPDNICGQHHAALPGQAGRYAGAQHPGQQDLAQVLSLLLNHLSRPRFLGVIVLLTWLLVMCPAYCAVKNVFAPRKQRCGTS